LNLGCGGIAIMATLLWLGSFFGENGVQYVLWAVIGLVLLLALLGAAFDPNRSAPPPPQQPKPNAAAAEVPPQAEPSGRERVWAWYENEICFRFSSEARSKAHALHEKNDVLALDRLCREEVTRLKMAGRL
jgi:hypothetical protein